MLKDRFKKMLKDIKDEKKIAESARVVIYQEMEQPTLFVRDPDLYAIKITKLRELNDTIEELIGEQSRAEVLIERYYGN